MWDRFRKRHSSKSWKNCCNNTATEKTTGSFLISNDPVVFYSRYFTPTELSYSPCFCRSMPPVKRDRKDDKQNGDRIPRIGYALFYGHSPTVPGKYAAVRRSLRPSARDRCFCWRKYVLEKVDVNELSPPFYQPVEFFAGNRYYCHDKNS